MSIGIATCLLAILPLWAGQEDPVAGQTFAIEIVQTPTPARCPDRSEVADALTTRLPNVLTADAPQRETTAGAAPTLLRLRLGQSGSSSVHLELMDQSGGVVLERTLPIAGVATDRDPAARSPSRGACVALADTVGLIVERYLRLIGYQGKPPPPPPPSSPTDPTRAQPIAGNLPPPSVAPAPSVARPPVAQAMISSQLSGPSVFAGPAAPEAPPTPAPLRFYVGAGLTVSGPVGELGGDSRVTRYGHIAGDLHGALLAFSGSLGVGEATQSSPVAELGGGTIRLIPIPVRLGGGVRLRTGPGIFTPVVALGANVLLISATGIQGQRPRATVEPVVEAGAAYFVPVRWRTYLKFHSEVTLGLRPRDFVLLQESEPTAIVYRSARLSLGGGVDLGIAFDP